MFYLTSQNGQLAFENAFIYSLWNGIFVARLQIQNIFLECNYNLAIDLMRRCRWTSAAYSTQTFDINLFWLYVTMDLLYLLEIN